MALDADLRSAVAARTGGTVDDAWLEQEFVLTLAFVRSVMAPCKSADWTSYATLPADVQAAVVAALARASQNPRNIRQETIGEYSYTLASGGGSAGPFSQAEARIINAVAGCGGRTRTVPVVLPGVLVIDAPEVTGLPAWPGVL